MPQQGGMDPSSQHEVDAPITPRREAAIGSPSLLSNLASKVAYNILRRRSISPRNICGFLNVGRNSTKIVCAMHTMQTLLLEPH